MKAFLQALQQSLQSMLIVDIRRVIAMCQTNVAVAESLGVKKCACLSGAGPMKIQKLGVRWGRHKGFHIIAEQDLKLSADTQYMLGQEVRRLLSKGPS